MNRLIGPEGLYIYPLTYKDVNDASEEERNRHKDFFAQSEAYKRIRQGLNVGSKTNRNFCVYAYKGPEFVGSTIMKEFLDNPDGYGENDFLYTKWVYPAFEQSKESRHMSGDLFHMLFMSGLAKRMYSYTPGRADAVSKFFFDRVDSSSPCIPNRYATDNIMLQKYISVSKEIDVDGKFYVILNMDGDTYRSMDHLAYLMAPGGPARTQEKCEEWLKQMDLAAEVVKKYANS